MKVDTAILLLATLRTNKMNPNILWNLGGGVIAGIAVGLALKTAVRWVLICLGLAILALMLLMHAGIITIHWGALSHGLEATVANIGDMVELAVADLSAQLVGFTAGMALGVKWR